MHDLLLYFHNHNLFSFGQSESFISASCSEKHLSGVQLIGLGSEARLEGTTSILEPGAAFDAMLHIVQFTAVLQYIAMIKDGDIYIY